MPHPNAAALDFLLNRRSRSAKVMTLPVPSRDQINLILTAATRVPDHGKLEPWRFIIVEHRAMARMASLAAARAKALGYDQEKTDKGRGQFDRGLLAVVVIASPKASEKVPVAEQTLSAGALCLGVLNAAEASGWAANWLSGWPSHDPDFIADAFGCAAHETLAGIIHIGTEGPPAPDRPRPDVARLTTWMAD